MKKEKNIKRKAVVRPSNPLMGFRADPIARAAIVKWSKNQSDKPTIPEAIRRLVSLGLSAKAHVKQTSRTRANKANAMAANQLDRLADPCATAEEQESRKHRLLQGPTEFRDVRVDRQKGGRR
jgi:hypothetical protein